MFQKTLLLATVASLGLAHSISPACPPQAYCKGANFTNADNVCGDWRLGPVELPDFYPANIITANYDPYVNTCPDEQGFFIDSVTGEPDRRNNTLVINTLLDRFGGEGGDFLAPYLSPYEDRALPPSNLATNDPNYPYNYHIYRVIQDLNVEEGKIAPWFGQRGQGVQYKTFKSVSVLVETGFLERVKNEDAPYS